MCLYLYLKLFKPIYMYLYFLFICIMYLYDSITLFSNTFRCIYEKTDLREAYVPQQWSVSRASQALRQELAMIQPHVFDSQTR